MEEGIIEPILLYPKNAAQAKFFHDAAEKQGVEAARISRKFFEEMDDFLFTKKLIERSKNAKFVSEAEFEKMVERKLAE